MACDGRESHSDGHPAMMRNPAPSFIEIDRGPMSSRDVVEAWIIIALLLCATLIGVALDQAIAP